MEETHGRDIFLRRKYYDIGLNLFCRQFREPEKVIREAKDHGVCCILTGTDPKENQKIHTFVKTQEAYGTAGIHPHNADRARQEDFRMIEQIIEENKRIVAVGECGLDYDRMFSTKENQIRCLEKHIVLAEKLDKPLFLHERSASEDFVKRFRKHPKICEKSVVHCFTGDKETLEQYLSMGFSIGITGWICDDKRAGKLREAVQKIPLDRILVETDAPYLTPKNVPGLARTNVPQNIVYVVRELAKYMNVSEEVLMEHAKENTQRIFRIEGSF
ncbi:MAG: TatD family hydrolase [Lachnospiraceae bacterium]|nr:TatD family hydrolase [Lachnospiraceae bacterium]